MSAIAWFVTGFIGGIAFTGFMCALFQIFADEYEVPPDNRFPEYEDSDFDPGDEASRD